MRQYLDVMQQILDHGHIKSDRTEHGTRSLFGMHMDFNILHDGFPLLTTKKLHLKSIIYELLWFLMGSDNKTWLNEHGITIWDEWADKNGYLGPIYGYQWRSWPMGRLAHYDQIASVINMLNKNPDDRRMIVSAWNVGMLEEMRLPPCHLLFQFYSHELTLYERALWFNRVRGLFERSLWFNKIGDLEADPLAISSYYFEKVIYGNSELKLNLISELDKANVPKRGLSCQLYQRSCDWFLGVPFNVASYSLLTMMVAQCTGHVPYAFHWRGGDCHLYLNHLDQAREQLQRNPLKLPWMRINGEITDIDKFEYEDFTLIGYDNPHPHIKAPINV